MKKWIIIGLLLFTAMAQAQKINYEELMEMDGITTVYVSEAMFKLLPKETLNANVKNVDLAKMVGGMKEIYIFTTEDATKKKILKAMFSNQSVKSPNIEMLMFVKDGSDRVKMFAEKKGQRVTGLFLHAEEEKEFTVISILGDFFMEDIQKAISGEQKKEK